jgi:hypothetical protein
MPKRRLAISEDQEDGSQPLINKRHEAFCLAFVGECRDNAAAAYLAAGYKNKNAHVNGCQLLIKTNIKRRIKHLEDELAEQEKLKAIDAIRHLKAIATVTITDFMNPDGTLDESKLQDRNLTQAIQELTPTFDKDGVRIGWKLKLKDSMRALELLGLTEKEEVVQNNQVLVIKA